MSPTSLGPGLTRLSHGLWKTFQPVAFPGLIPTTVNHTLSKESHFSKDCHLLQNGFTKS